MKTFINPDKSYKEIRSEVEASADSAPEPEIVEETQATGPVRVPVKEKPAAKSASEPVASASPEPGTKAKVKCAFRIPRPETPSQNQKYMELIEDYGEDAAIKFFLRDAMDEWMKSYTSTAPIDQTPRYAKSRDAYATTRYLDGDLFEQVRSRIDPQNRRPPGYIARSIALTALANHLKRH